MSDFLRHGGVFMWSSMACGVFAVAVATAHAVRPDRDRLPLVRTLCVAALLFGFLGGGSGLIKLLQVVGQRATPADPGWGLLFRGLSEVLYNPMASLLWCALAAFVTALGGVRATRRPSPAR